MMMTMMMMSGRCHHRLVFTRSGPRTPFRISGCPRTRPSEHRPRRLDHNITLSLMTSVQPGHHAATRAFNYAAYIASYNYSASS